MLEGIENSLCYREQGECYDCGCEPERDYCYVRAGRSGQCLCQTWVIIHYVGEYMIAAEDWQPFFVKTLEGVKCEYFGRETIVPVGLGHPPGWFFFIRLDDVTSRSEVRRRFDCKSALEEVQKLGDPGIVELDDNFGCFFRSLTTCCIRDFFHMVNPKIASFGSNLDLLHKLLEREKKAFECFETLIESC